MNKEEIVKKFVDDFYRTGKFDSSSCSKELLELGMSEEEVWDFMAEQHKNIKGLCNYCGEERATEKIIDPNMPLDSIETPTWDVCKDCKETIKLQQGLSFNSMVLSGATSDKVGSACEKEIADINKKLKEIADRTKKPISSSSIVKQGDGSYETASITFTGEGDNEEE